MIDDSGQYNVSKLRKSGNFGTWVTILAMGAGLVAAWATNANRLAYVEQEQLDGKIEREHMELHLSSNDQQIAVLKERLQFIIEQLAAANAKLDRAEEERHR